MWEIQKCQSCHKFGIQVHCLSKFLCACTISKDDRVFPVDTTSNNTKRKKFTFRDRFCEYNLELSDEAYALAESNDLYFVTLFVDSQSQKCRFTYDKYFTDFYQWHDLEGSPNEMTNSLLNARISRIKSCLLQQKHCVLRKIQWKNSRVPQPSHERQHQQSLRRQTVSDVLNIQQHIDAQASTLSYNIATNKTKFRQERELRRNLGQEPHNRHYGRNIIKVSNDKILDEQKQNILHPLELSSGTWIPYELKKIDAPQALIGSEAVNDAVYSRLQIFRLMIEPSEHSNYFVASPQSEVVDAILSIFQKTNIKLTDISVQFYKLNEHNQYKKLAQNQLIDNETYIKITLVNENFVDVMRSAQICQEYAILFNWKVILPKRSKFTVSCGTDAITIFKHMFTELDPNVVNKLNEDELELHLLTHFDGIGHPEVTYIHLRAFCPNLPVFKNGKKLSKVYPMTAIMDKDIKVKPHVRQQHRQLENATRFSYRIDQLSKKLTLSRFVYHTSDRKILKAGTGGKANHAQAAIHYHVCLFYYMLTLCELQITSL